MKLFERKPQIKGEIGYFKLTDWWLETFSAEERDYIERTYAPIGAGGGDGLGPQNGLLTKCNITSSTQTVCMFLSGLSSWFRKTAHDRDIARRLLAKSVEISNADEDALGLHFTYQVLIEVWYRDREILSQGLEEAIKACREQIALAPKAARQFRKELPSRPLPGHIGYKQLTIILDKQGYYTEAIKVAQQAKTQGWDGDWDERISRYQKKRNPE